MAFGLDGRKTPASVAGYQPKRVVMPFMKSPINSNLH